MMAVMSEEVRDNRLVVGFLVLGRLDVGKQHHRPQGLSR